MQMKKNATLCFQLPWFACGSKKKNVVLCFQMPWFACGSNEEKCNFVSLDADSPDPVCWHDGRSWGNG